MEIIFHHRICAGSLRLVESVLVQALSCAFVVTPRHSLPLTRRFFIDAHSGPSLAPRVELTLVLGSGDTVEAIVACPRRGLPVFRSALAHADEVVYRIMRAVDDIPSHPSGIDGYWMTPLGWFLRLYDGQFHSERWVVLDACSCGGAWHETARGRFGIDGARLTMHTDQFSARWISGLASTGYHQHACEGSVSHTVLPVSLALGARQFTIRARSERSMLFDDQTRSGGRFEFRAIGVPLVGSAL
jgi:hypothetical protein